MKEFLCTTAACAALFAAVVLLVGPLASPGTLAFRLAMRIYMGT